MLIDDRDAQTRRRVIRGIRFSVVRLSWYCDVQGVQKNDTVQQQSDAFFRLVGDGAISAKSLAEQLRVNKTQLADALGVGAESLRRQNRERAARVQTRMRDMIEIINRVQPWAGTVNQAFAWYRSQGLPSFGGMTAEELVKDGRADAVKQYLARINIGGFA